MVVQIVIFGSPVTTLRDLQIKKREEAGQNGKRREEQRGTEKSREERSKRRKHRMHSAVPGGAIYQGTERLMVKHQRLIPGIGTRAWRHRLAQGVASCGRWRAVVQRLSAGLIPVACTRGGTEASKRMSMG